MPERICTTDGCQRNAHARGMCSTHYSKARQQWTPACRIDGCLRSAKAKGLCNAHYLRIWFHGDAAAEVPVLEMRRDYPDTCSVDGCDQPHFARGWCGTHFSRWRRTGDPTKLTGPRIRRGPEVHNWAGDAIGYYGAHARLTNALGKASDHTCPCGRPAQHWAYDHTDPDEKISPKGSPYSTDVDRYIAMCASCHFLLDNAHRRQRTT